MGPSPSNRPPALGPPGQPRPKPPVPEAPPAAGPQPDDSTIQPNPEAVGYRTEAETCGHCTYFTQDFCQYPVVAQQVAAGDSCAAFEAKGGGMDEGDPMSTGQEPGMGE